MRLYEAAEMGNEKLKQAIQAKDSKLQQAETELYKIKKVGQASLLKKSRALLYIYLQYLFPDIENTININTMNILVTKILTWCLKYEQ